jgi:hypothetical protein
MANEAMSMSLQVVSPTIRTDRTEFFLGEQIAFEIGKRTARRLMALRWQQLCVSYR